MIYRVWTSCFASQRHKRPHITVHSALDIQVITKQLAPIFRKTRDHNFPVTCFLLLFFPHFPPSVACKPL